LDLLASVAPAVLPTLSQSLQGVSVWFKDLAVTSMLQTVIVEVTPITLAGEIRDSGLSIISSPNSSFPCVYFIADIEIFPITL